MAELTETRHIDLNADLGEGGQHDQELLQIVSSASISCGVHAGNEDTIRAALKNARLLGVNAGAHPSWPDREHFGRRTMNLGADKLRACVHSQLDYLEQLAHEEGVRLSHVKPHGALYNQAAADAELAAGLVECIRSFNDSYTIFAPAGSELLAAAERAGLHTCSEAFADRRYAADGTLLPRTDPGAVILDVQQAIDQSLRIARDGLLQATDGSTVQVRADTLCIHGDNSHALLLARRLREALTQAGIRIGFGKAF